MKWSGLGMCLFSTTDTTQFDSEVDTLLSKECTNLRIDIPDYYNASWLARSKAAIIRAIVKGANVTWGVSSNSGNNALYTLIEENFTNFSDGVLAAAQWAQDNGVFEFQIGNEEETITFIDVLLEH